MSTLFPAHIRIDGTAKSVQTVQSHCRGTAQIARSSLAETGLESAAYLAGLLHDTGKFSEAFRNYIEQSVEEKNSYRGSVNHSFAGVCLLLRQYHTSKDKNDLAPIVAELLAFAVGAHHGLFDCVDKYGHSGFQHRLSTSNIQCEEAIENFFVQCADKNELDQMFDIAVQELSPVILSLCDLAQQNEFYDGEVLFYLGLLARLLLSAVIEGDRSDTAEFMTGIVLPIVSTDRRKLWEICLTRMEQKLSKFPDDSAIYCARQSISQQCRASAELPSGVYRLNAPTGAGKTLASLRYALAHAAKWNKHRIIFSSSLLSILDQNALVIRNYIQDDSIILEHHSNVIRDQNSSEAIIDSTDSELLTENWKSPIIITTLVQLLDTLFSGKTSCIRRFQALSESVIVVDEVQTIPPRMLTLFNLAVNFLSEVCGATIVLCSATQPCLGQTVHPITVSIRDMVCYDSKLWEPFHRTTILDAGSCRLEDIPDFVIQQMEQTGSLLLVCNKKDEAAYLYRELSGQGYHCFHLSASMCMAHRKKTLASLESSLNSQLGKKTICVATQVIEAGVDISFDCVIRLAAGMDNIIQAAGRCNRNGKDSRPAPVYILQCTDEKLGRLQDIQNAKDATTSLLAQFQQHPDDFQNDISSDEAVRYYYQRLYREMPREFQDYKVKDKPSIYSLLSLNSDYMEDESGFTLNQAFKEAGMLFHVFDEETEDVIVPYGEGEKCISALCSEQSKFDTTYFQICLNRAKPYTVSLFRYQCQQLVHQGGIDSICDGKVLVLHPRFYDTEVGLLLQGSQNDYLEVN